MRIFLSILAVLVIVVAGLVITLNVTQVVGLWYINGQTKEVITTTLTAADHLLLDADQEMVLVDEVIDQVVEVGDVIDTELATVPDDDAFVESARDISTQANDWLVWGQSRFATLRSDVQRTERIIAFHLPRVPLYVNLTWLAVTLVLAWRVLAQVALIYLAVRYLRTGSIGSARQDAAVATAATDAPAPA